MLELAKYSFGVGDRFAHQAKAQLRACQMAVEQGVEIVPVWNKSYREHTTIGSEPASVRAAADAAVRDLGWTRPYHVDADHIRLETVDGFLDSSDFYTIDVADSIGKPADPAQIAAFAERHAELVGRLAIPGIEAPFDMTRADLERIAGKYLLAVQEAGGIYRHIEDAKGEDGVHHRSLDGRDRQPADAGANCWSSWPPSPTRAFPSRPSRRSSPAGSTRAWIMSATSPSSRRSSATTSP